MEHLPYKKGADAVTKRLQPMFDAFKKKLGTFRRVAFDRHFVKVGTQGDHSVICLFVLFYVIKYFFKYVCDLRITCSGARLHRCTSRYLLHCNDLTKNKIGIYFGD